MNNCSDDRNIRLAYKALAHKEWGNLFPHGAVGYVVGAYKALAHKEWGNLFPHGVVVGFVGRHASLAPVGNKFPTSLSRFALGCAL